MLNFNILKINNLRIFFLLLLGIILVLIPDSPKIILLDKIINRYLSGFTSGFTEGVLRPGARIVWILWLFGAVLIFNALCEIIKKVANRKGSVYFFLFQVIGSFFIVSLGYRSLLGVGLGLHPAVDSSGMISSGIIFNHADTLNYLSWASQARFGSYLFMDLATIDPHKALYFNPFFLAIGKISAWLNLPIFSVFYMVGIFVACPIVVVGTYYCSRSMGISENGAKWGTIIATFSSGLTLPLFVMGWLFHFSPTKGTDLRVLDSIISATLLVYPLHAMAIAFLSITVFLMLIADNDHTFFDKSFLISLSICLIAALFVSTHPYESVLFLSSYVCYCFLSIFSEPIIKWRRRLYILVLVSIVVVPIVSYYYLVSQQPVWNWTFSDVTSTLYDKTRLAWIIGYGLTLPLALYGGYCAFINTQYEKARWFAIWVFLLIVLLIILNTNVKLSNGGYFPMCVLAGLGFGELISITSRIESGYLRKSGKAFTAIIGILLFLTFPGYLIRLYAHSFDVELIYATQIIRSLEGSKNPKVLTDSETGLLLPVLGGVRVYAGHFGLTPDIKIKHRELIEAGIQKPLFYDKGPFDVTKENFLKTLHSHKFDFVLIDKNRPAYDFANHTKELFLIKSYNRWCLYSTRNVAHKDKKIIGKTMLY
jgi:hypothetical protein